MLARWLLLPFRIIAVIAGTLLWLTAVPIADTLSRNRFLCKAAGFVGLLLLKPVRALAATSAGWPHSFTGLMQNGIGSTQGSVHMHWDLPNSDFVIDLCYRVFNAVKGTQGWFIYREQNSSNYYQLQMYSDHLALVVRVAGVFTPKKTCPYVISPGNEMMVRVQVQGDRHQVWQLNPDRTLGALLLDWTDSTYLSGVNYSYYTMPGVNGCWEFADGRPL